MVCSFITLLCIVGGVQSGPDEYRIDVFDRMDNAFYEVYVPIAHKDKAISLLKF